ncbi:inactive hydroxysteroid dehydrogenase 1 [Brachionus plicatilis]|uniref:Inactive hydroxysteroid dehydrogenase 1 n=1 Tax=Brachionus plicatilis TaxID=10195 RepID=A0A3M7P2C2_BRAPC|nr:inactive hydroxysteroid dehydrogenase 1 [Brachionus plicatilis]
MNTSDSFSLLLNELSRDLSDINDRLALVGILYLGKKSIEAFRNFSRAIGHYLIPAFVSNDKWLRSLGNWAIVFGCLNQIGYGYARELAKRKINLILIDQNQELLTRMSQALSSDFQIEAIIINIDSRNFGSLVPVEKAIIGRDIGILVNSSCFDQEWSYFHALSKNFIENSICSNVATFSLLVRMILPSMFQKNKGAIVNFSTKNSLFSSPFMSISGATNSFTEKFIESLSYEYSNKNLFFQTINTGFLNEEKIKFENDIELSKNLALYSSSAIRTLGWSGYSFGYWLNAFKVFLIMKNFPLNFSNFMYSRILRRKFIKSIENIAKKSK